MKAAQTPCIGICSTTSFGDRICRGCKRFNFEVIDWNGYSEREKQAVLKRIDQLTTQIMAARFRIYSVPMLEQAMHDWQFFYDASLSPYCWLHNLLQKQGHRITELRDLGVEKVPEFATVDIRELVLDANKKLFALSEAHFDRYFRLPENRGRVE